MWPTLTLILTLTLTLLLAITLILNINPSPDQAQQGDALVTEGDAAGVRRPHAYFRFRVRVGVRAGLVCASCTPRSLNPAVTVTQCGP